MITIVSIPFLLVVAIANVGIPGETASARNGWELQLTADRPDRLLDIVAERDLTVLRSL